MHCSYELKRRWERRKDSRPQELLAAALDLFVERGFASTRLEDVAKRAGVSKGTLYLYFTNKEELFKAVVRDSIVPSIGEAELHIAEFKGCSAELLRFVIMDWWEHLGNTKASGIMKLMMAEAGNFPELAQFYREEVIQRWSTMVGGMLARGVERGEFSPMNVEAMTHVLVAPMLMLVTWKHSLGACGTAPIDPLSFLDTFLSTALNGLLPRSPVAACAPEAAPITLPIALA